MKPMDLHHQQKNKQKKNKIPTHFRLCELTNNSISITVKLIDEYIRLILRTDTTKIIVYLCKSTHPEKASTWKSKPRRILPIHILDISCDSTEQSF